MEVSGQLYASAALTLEKVLQGPGTVWTCLLYRGQNSDPIVVQPEASRYTAPCI
jgi:hypothetical protein